ncbi:LysR substrate-binding domain-containing protein [Methylocapsa sp. S129]|uniref:LysR substrate-binding domain-containing protein n=1 Tax=Methylocapsa sp. S129 TaxID=1641869 RepID=UPI00131AF86A|nr:LysR substrate-binding domain-containing protein [Methylocapsa sp. S129]
MTLVQLRALLAVARYNGFTAAAHALRSSQTTLTTQIQALEEEHGVELFHRRGRRIELTDVGVEFLQIARRMVSLEDDARLLLEDSGALRRGSLRLGAVSPYHVIEMIEAFHKTFPDVHLSMKLGNSETVLQDIDDYACEVGILAKSVADERYHMRPYATYPVIAFVHRNHRLAGSTSLSLEALAKERLLMRESGSTTRRALEGGFARLGLVPNVAMEVGSREAVREGVARELGVGTVSMSEYVPDERLRPLRIEGDPVATHIHVCCLRERRRSRTIAAFLDAVERIRPAEHAPDVRRATSDFP